MASAVIISIIKWLRRFKTPIILISITLIVINGCYNFVNYSIGDLYYQVGTYKVENFRKYKKDFNTLVKLSNKLFNDYLDSDNDLLWLSIRPSGDSLHIVCGNSDEQTVSYDKPMDSDIQKSFDNIYHKVFTAYNDNPIAFTGIVVTKGQVEFRCERPYAVVYSKKRPKKIGDSDLDSFWVGRLAHNWYQVAWRN